jgi:acetyltransferase-like isoleucine patch superfamily enzyme
VSRKLKLFFLAVTCALPSAVSLTLLKVFFGYKIGKRVKLGFSIVDATECEIGDDVSIGHFNVFTGIEKLSIGEHSRIGALNIFRGGYEISIGRYCDILRLNEINSIPEPEVVNETDPRFIMGDGSMIAASHKIDFTDRVEMRSRVILGGRNSSIWTHNRQRTQPVVVGPRTYLGSEIRIAPGVEIAANCIVGMGSVVTGKHSEEFMLIGGVPAKVLKPLDDDGRFLVERKTRKDLPDDI